MKIIAIEGLDKAGKHTATDLLYRYFENKGMWVEMFSMPNYDSPMGKIISDYLCGAFKSDPKTFDLLQAADKQHMQNHILELEEKGVDVLIIDRYVHSQIAYGAVTNDISWLKELSKYYRMPDTVLYLDVEPEVSMHRRGKFGDNDLYESDLGRLRATRDEYNKLFKDCDYVKHVDANSPKPIVKSQILEIVCDLYSEYCRCVDKAD